MVGIQVQGPAINVIQGQVSDITYSNRKSFYFPLSRRIGHMGIPSIFKNQSAFDYFCGQYNARLNFLRFSLVPNFSLTDLEVNS